MLEAAKLLLAPVLLWQGRQVRCQALRLPEAAGARVGMTGQGELKLRLLIVGDSSAAGVGAPSQRQALAGCLSEALAQGLQGRVHWQLLARSGDTTTDALARFGAAELASADVMVTALGVNDVVAQRSPRACAAELDALHEQARERLGLRYSLHSAVPPMHAFPALPQPLRWMLGAQALRHNRVLARHLMGRTDRGLQGLPAGLQGRAAATHMADDGFHPGVSGYALWAQSLAQRLLREQAHWAAG